MISWVIIIWDGTIGCGGETSTESVGDEAVGNGSGFDMSVDVTGRGIRVPMGDHTDAGDGDGNVAGDNGGDE